jgi:uncharacterized membrane protein HdeD (DUF308 family)
MIDSFTRRWWLVALRGALTLIFGILALLFPSSALLALILIFGVYAFLDGAFALVAAFSLRPVRPLWLFLLTEGIVGILVGIFAFALPGMTALALLYLAAAWAIVTGIFQIVGAERLREHLAGNWFMMLAGVASVVLGILLMAMPRAGLFLWVVLVAAYAVITGVLLISLAFRMRALSSGGSRPISAPPGAHPA